MKKTITALLLAALLTLPALAACSKDDGETSVRPDTSGTTSEEALPFEVKNFGGQEIHVIARSNHTYGEMQFVADEELSSNQINDAVATRNNLIEDTYGIKILCTADGSPMATARPLITAGLCEYDIICDSVNNMLPMVSEKCFWSLDDLLNLSESYYDQRANDNLRLGDKTYFVAGDMLITDDDYTYCCLYNKDMYADNTSLAAKYGDIYDIVRNGKWTYDIFYEMCKAVSEPDENGQWETAGGTYGNISEGYVTAIWVNGAGVRTVEKGAEPYSLTLNVKSDRSVAAFNKVFEIMSDKSNTIRVEQLGDSGWSDTAKMFQNGQGLFWGTNVSSITANLLSSTSDEIVSFGVLPVPKLDEEQDTYYNGINAYQSSVIGIPSSNGDNLEATAYLIELLGYYGQGVKDAYYEKTLKLQAVEEDADAEMLDLIFNTRLYDLGAIFNWGGNLIGIYSSVMRSGSNTLISSFEALETAAQAAMDQTIQDYKNSIT